VTRVGWCTSLAAVALAGLVGGCDRHGHAVDPLTNRLADMCGIDPQTLSYWGRGAGGFGGPGPYVWQTADFTQSVELASRAGVSSDRRMFVTCSGSHVVRRIKIDERELPRETPNTAP
jgi:hypothetical protein